MTKNTILERLELRNYLIRRGNEYVMAAFAILFSVSCGCGGARQINAIKNSSFAYSEVRPIELSIAETGRVKSLHDLYIELCIIESIKPLSTRLSNTLDGNTLKYKIKDYTKTYMNPFVVVDASQADMHLNIRIEDFYFHNETLSGGEKAKELIKSAFLPNSFPDNFINLECELIDNTVGRIVYKFDLSVKEQKNVFGQGALQALLDRAFDQLIDRLLKT